MAPEQYSTVVGGGAAPSLADSYFLLEPDGVSLPATLIQSRGQLTRTRIIYTCLFGKSAAGIAKLAEFVARIKEEELMLLDYVP